MYMPKLHIESTQGKLGLNIQQPIQEIQQPQAELELEQPAAILEINTIKPELSIDTIEARADLDLMSSIRRTAEVASYSRGQLLEGISRRAGEGDDLMHIENGGNPIAEHAKQSGRQPYSSLGIKFIPSPGGVKISYQPGKVNIEAQPQKVINNTKINKPIHEYAPGKVTTEMLQYPSLKIDWQV
ncbi:DUF6470 family protein [Rummeliibacillus sp. G93]|uniref:DUF6470 family protein n=1 Tax=Rummeliibacillus sp. G93 TaxID=2939494 RepID=UPI00201BC01A|nr:DUF6470 family protein [Rummeliibacillus sp. G93]UQW98005.1 DUF6470 family protein [Rummeliibacillus sp. G93]